MFVISVGKLIIYFGFRFVEQWSFSLVLLAYKSLAYWPSLKYLKLEFFIPCTFYKQG